MRPLAVFAESAVFRVHLLKYATSTTSSVKDILRLLQIEEVIVHVHILSVKGALKHVLKNDRAGLHEKYIDLNRRNINSWVESLIFETLNASRIGVFLQNFLRPKADFRKLS